MMLKISSIGMAGKYRDGVIEVKGGLENYIQK